jgi:hypothetical protein
MNRRGDKRSQLTHTEHAMMNARARLAQIERTPSSQPGMLEAMAKRLYIRRFPQTDALASAITTDAQKRVLEDWEAARMTGPEKD